MHNYAVFFFIILVCLFQKKERKKERKKGYLKFIYTATPDFGLTLGLLISSKRKPKGTVEKVIIPKDEYLL